MGPAGLSCPGQGPPGYTEGKEVSMEGPRTPVESEWTRVIDFLNQRLREGSSWSIATEYPTALVPSNLHNMRIITDQEKVLSHAVLKPLVIKSPHVIYKVGAIGSVVTDPAHRGQGLSTKIIQDCISEARRQQCDIAVLWTDQYDFYRRMGFELAGHEMSVTLDATYTVPTADLKFSDDLKVSPEALHRLYSSHTVGTVRTTEEIRKFLTIPQTRLYTAWDNKGQLAAYAVVGKGVDLGGYVHEWGGGVSKLLPLLSWARSRQDQGILTLIAPQHSQNLLSQLRSQGANITPGFLGMIKILNFDSLAAKIKRAFRAEGVGDIVLESRNGELIFGVGQELFTLREEGDITRLLFGPVDIQSLDMLSEVARLKLAKVLPLPLWIWGWDSV